MFELQLDGQGLGFLPPLVGVLRQQPVCFRGDDRLLRRELLRVGRSIRLN
jgi:hypothetical protein